MYILFILISAMSASAGMQSAIEHNRVIWRFDKAYPCGQYVNGDWWVQGPVTVIGMEPGFDGAHHGWEADPAVSNVQGFDARGPGFDSGLVPSLPYTAQPGQTLMKGVSRDTALAACRPCLRTADVLTVVADIPADSGTTLFRPPYIVGDKPSYSSFGLHTELLPALHAAAEVPSLTQVADNFARFHPDHMTSFEYLRHIHPQEHMPDYGAAMGIQTAEAVLRISLEGSLAEKMPAVIGLTQYGIDLFHITLAGHAWPADGGQGWGRTLPILFSSVMLDDPDMKAYLDTVSRTVSAPGQAVRFSPVAAGDDGIVLYGEPGRFCTPQVYWNKLVDHNAVGSKTCSDPYGYIDGGIEPGGGYQFCCVNNPIKQVAIALYVFPALNKVWNDSLALRYADRWVDHGAWTQPDPCAPPETTMDNYGITFGDDPANPGDCIRDTDSTDGIGRFPQLHGIGAGGGYYRSTFADAMWERYRDSTFTSDVGFRSALPAPGPVMTIAGNPSRLPLTVEFVLPGSGTATLMAYNATGVRIGTICKGQFDAGVYRESWNGPGMLADDVIYLVLQYDGQQVVTRVLVVQ